MEAYRKGKSYPSTTDGRGTLNIKTLGSFNPTNRATLEVEMGIGVCSQAVFEYANPNDRNIQKRILICYH